MALSMSYPTPCWDPISKTMRSFIDKGYGWPLFVIILLVSSVAMMGIVVMAARSDGGAQVIEDYYEQAVRWDSLAEARGAAAALGWQADLVMSSNNGRLEGTVSLVDSMGMALVGLDIVIRLRRPQLAAVVAEMKAQDTAGTGYYAFATDVTGTGLWDIEAEIANSGGIGKAIQLDWRRDVR